MFFNRIIRHVNFYISPKYKCNFSNDFKYLYQNFYRIERYLSIDIDNKQYIDEHYINSLDIIIMEEQLLMKSLVQACDS